MKTVILHIGTGKTGTSSIQNYLANNRPDLVKSWSLDYIGYGLSDHKYFNERMVAHYPVVEWLVSGDVKKLNTMKQAMEDSPCDCVLLSCENFYHDLGPSHIGLLSGLLEAFNVMIICYVRRQDFAAESAWKQQVRVGLEVTPFDDFKKIHKDPSWLHKVQLNYFRMLAPWAQSFGEHNIKLRVFQKSSFIGGDLLPDFFSTLGISKAYKPGLMRSEYSNKSLPSGFIELISVINNLGLVAKENHHALVNAIESSSAVFDSRPMLDTQDRQEILENYSAVNEKLFHKYKPRNGTMGFDVSDIY